MTTEVSDRTKKAKERVQQAIAEMPPEIQEHFERLKKLLNKFDRDGLKRNYEIGLIVKEAYATYFKRLRVPKVSTYGDNIVGQLEVALQLPKRFLYTCHLLVKRVDREEFDNWLSLGCLKWSHVLVLIGVPLRPERDRLAKLARESGYTASELASVAFREEALKPRGPGRPLKRPRNAKDALRKCLKGSTDFLRRSDEIWFSEEFEIASGIEDMGPFEYTPELRGEITEAITSLKRIATVAAENAKRMGETLEWVDQCLAKQAKHAPEDQEAA